MSLYEDLEGLIREIKQLLDNNPNDILLISMLVEVTKDINQLINKWELKLKEAI